MESNDIIGKIANNDINTYLNSISKYPRLSAEQEKLLADMMHNGSDAEKELAKDALIVSNLKLVVHIAKKYKELYPSLYDLISVGNKKLMSIVEDFHPEIHNTRFSTFAHIRILGAIRDEVDTFRKYTNTVPKSLDECVSLDNDLTFGDTVQCCNAREWWQIAESEEQIQLIRQAFEKLGERDRQILVSHHLKGHRLATIAEDMNLSRQRISQLYDRAFSKLKELCLEAA